MATSNTARPSTQASKAWATLLTRDSYLAGVLILNRSLRQFNSAYPLIVILTPTVPDTTRAILDEAGIQWKEIEFLEPKEKVNVLVDRFRDTWSKLRVFELIEFERVILLDSDMMLMKSMDSLMDLELPSDWIAANHACTCNPTKMDIYPPDCIPELCPYTPLSHPKALTEPIQPTNDSPRTHTLLNSGLVILTPSASLFASITNFLYTSPLIKEMSFPDQDLLAEFFKGKWKAIGWQYNAIKTLGYPYLHPDIWRVDEIINLHYIVDKPWSARIVPGTGSEDEETHGWWWTAWDEFAAEWEADEKRGKMLESMRTNKLVAR